RPGSRRSPRSARCGETSSEALGERGVLVGPREIERGAALRIARRNVDALADQVELDGQRVVATDGVEKLPLVVVAKAHGRKVLARLERAPGIWHRVGRRTSRLAAGSRGEIAGDGGHPLLLLRRQAG